MRDRRSQSRSRSTEYEDEFDGQVSADSDTEGDERIIKEKRKKNGTCGCKGIAKATLSRIEAKPTLSERNRLELARSIVAAMESKSSGRNMCGHHIRRAAGKIGLATKGIKAAECFDRLEVYADPDTDIGKLKTGSNSGWWRLSDRPWLPADGLGPYRFFHDIIKPIYSIDEDTQQMHLDAMMSADEQRIWRSEGSIILSNVFDYWYEPLGAYGGASGMTLLSIFQDEMAMHEWHQRRINDRANLGWLRNMYHGLCQQVARQDLSYYRAYIALRPDGHTWLVSYPYYAKHTRDGDGTAFRHVDINIIKALKYGRGINQIQGSVSLDNENDDNCTIIIPGLHKEALARQWLDRMEERGAQPSDGFVNKIESKHFNKSDERVLGTQWRRQPCTAAQVRIAHPLLPHGSTGPATMLRRTILPWYVSVQEDHHVLEIPEAGTWGDLSAAHRDLHIGPCTPSGYSVNYGAIPYRFPCAMSLRLENPIALATVGQQRWDDPWVQKTLSDFIFAPGAAEGMIQQQREEFKRKVVERYRQLIHEEKLRYPGERSYFRWKQNGRAWQHPPPDRETRAGRERNAQQAPYLFEEPLDG
jgi:hypothetical protein